MHLLGRKKRPDVLDSTRRTRKIWQLAGVPASCFVKIDYLFVVNDMVAQAVLEASSRFSIKTGGCGRSPPPGPT